MILLRYDFKMYHIKSEPFHETVSGSDFHEKVTDILLNKVFDGLNFEFRNAGNLCLACEFTQKSYRQDSKFIRVERCDAPEKKRQQFYDGIINRITAELMAYERQEYEYREIMI